MSEVAAPERRSAVPEDAVVSPASQQTAPEGPGVPSPLPGLSREQDPLDPMGGASAPDSVATALSGGGAPLPDGVRRTMERSLGADFSGVRLHTGGAAERSAADISARAYTSGESIVLGRGSDLSSPSGLHTVAHELTHVVQQREGRDHGESGTVGLASDPLEHEAEATANDVVGALRRQSLDCRCGQEHG